ncbi:MAG: hypothetical protein ACRD8A_04575 [Candidatus Acidiferrales bacterium]
MKATSHARGLTNARTVLANASRRKAKQVWAVGTLATIKLILGPTSAEAAASFIHYQHAVAAHGQANATLRHGILILAVPTLVLFALIAGIVYKRRNVSR